MYPTLATRASVPLGSLQLKVSRRQWQSWQKRVRRSHWKLVQRMLDVVERVREEEPQGQSPPQLLYLQARCETKTTTLERSNSPASSTVNGSTTGRFVCLRLNGLPHQLGLWFRPLGWWSSIAARTSRYRHFGFTILFNGVYCI